MAGDDAGAGSGGRRAVLIGSMVEAVRAEGAAASIDALAGVAGVPKSVLYNHFADKDGLMAAVGDAVAAEWCDRLANAATTGDGPTGGRAAIEALVVSAAHEPELYDLVRSGGGRMVVSCRVERIGAQLAAAAAPPGTATSPVLAAASGGAVLAAVDRWLWTGADERGALVDELVAFLQAGFLPPSGPDPA